MLCSWVHVVVEEWREKGEGGRQLFVLSRTTCSHNIIPVFLIPSPIILPFSHYCGEIHLLKSCIPICSLNLFSLMCFIHSELFSINTRLRSPPGGFLCTVRTNTTFAVSVMIIPPCPLPLFPLNLSSHHHVLSVFFLPLLFLLFCLSLPASVLTAGLNHPRFCLPCHVCPPSPSSLHVRPGLITRRWR